MKKILVIIGTRPEAIKLAPLIIELRKRPGSFSVIAGITGQHKEAVFEALSLFQIGPDIEVNTQPPQNLSELNAYMLISCQSMLSKTTPDLVIVQGDTTSAYAGAMASFYSGIPVAHVEAGLRSGSLKSPFPEELNRIFISRVAAWHFAPTPAARDHLLAEGIPVERILLSGNTGIDAVQFGLQQMRSMLPDDMKAHREQIRKSRQKLIVVTLHRRENQPHLEKICADLLLLMEDEQFTMVFVTHPNPDVQKKVKRRLGKQPRIQLSEPLSYQEFLYLLDICSLIITDSGSIQEEAPTLGKPVVVLRSHTERQELLDGFGGVLCDPLIGNLKDAVNKALRIKTKPDAENPFGDGQASRRIAGFLSEAI
jgi:UDP-N-acetylglucosamine 2-epimerase (non-hydrolysing)